MSFADIFKAIQNRPEYENFVKRYNQGAPWEGYSGEEVLDRYGAVAHNVSSSDYQQAARESFERLSPEQRAEFVRAIQEQTKNRGINIQPPPSARQGSGGDVDWLSKATAQLHEQPGLIRDIFSSFTGGAKGSSQPGSTQPGSTQSSGGGAGELLSSPLAKAALAGITAMLVKRAMATSQRT
ncbi:MAG TPA: hypothetical protein VGH16_17415 [Candidatus Binatia bacterium]|jgi:hypothetical protein